MTIDFHSVSLPAEFAVGEVAPATAIAFTEGPAAAADGTVYFSDIANNRIMKFDSVAGTTSVFREPSGRANGLLFDPQGRLLACEGNEFGDNDGNRRITRTDLLTGEVEVLTDNFEGKKYVSGASGAGVIGGFGWCGRGSGGVWFDASGGRRAPDLVFASLVRIWSWDSGCSASQ